MDVLNEKCITNIIQHHILTISSYKQNPQFSLTRKTKCFNYDNLVC